MGNDPIELTGFIADVVGGRIFRGRIVVAAGKIVSVEEDPSAEGECFYTPGLIDAHVHIESSLLVPAEFARGAVVHGTVATVSDPHEIANVLGVKGVEWMVNNGKRTPFKFHWGAPSCVPATSFETAGAKFGPPEISRLLDLEGVEYLSEVMNFPAVVHGEERIQAIIAEAVKRGMPIDGHAPGLLGEDLQKYAAAGIQTDHECNTLEEGRQRCQLGMMVAIREGTAARNFEALWPLLNEFPEQVFFCSDDKHPDELCEGHINRICERALSKQVPLLTVLRAATLNPARHYRMPVGLLRPGDPADIVEWESKDVLDCRRCWINGECVAMEGKARLSKHAIHAINRFDADQKAAADFVWKRRKGPRPVIHAIDGQLFTLREEVDGAFPDVGKDLLTITVVNRYYNALPALGLVKCFGLKAGAIASSVAHDSHNVVAVGVDPESIAKAVNLVIQCKGGLSVCGPGFEQVLPLPIAGLMSDGDCHAVAAAYRQLSERAAALGCDLKSPFMTLSFMALLVIPKLKISDKGMFDVDKFELLSEA